MAAGRCTAGCGESNPVDKRLSVDCDHAQQILWAERTLARLQDRPLPEVPDWLTHSICADAGLYVAVKR